MFIGSTTTSPLDPPKENRAEGLGPLGCRRFWGSSEGWDGKKLRYDELCICIEGQSPLLCSYIVVSGAVLV